MKKTIFILSLFLLVNFSYSQNSLQFAKSIASTGSIITNGGVVIKDVLTDSNGNTYFFGYYFGTCDFDPNAGVTEKTAILTDGFVVKFDTGGNLIWVNTEAVAGDQEISAGVINVGSIFTNVLTVVQKNSLNTFSLKQLNLTNGETTFTSSSYSTNSGNNAININSIAVFNTATVTNYYLGGSFLGTITLGASTATSAGNLDAFSCCFRTTNETNPFTFQWLNTYGGAGNDEINDLSAPSNSVLNLIGYFSQTSDFDGNTSTNTISRTSAGLKDGFFAVVSSSNGRPTATDNVITIGGTGNDVFLNISGESNNYFLCGSFSGTVDFDPSATVNSKTATGGTDGFVARYNSSTPDLAWVQTSGTSGFNDEITDITSNSGTNRVYFCGYTSNSSGGKTIQLASLFFDGSTNAFGGPLTPATATSQNYPTAITQNDYDIYTVGIFNDTVDFNPSASSFTLNNSPSGNNGFVSKMTFCGFPAITPVINGTSNSCASNQIPLTISNPNLRNNEQWKWYSASCGGTLVGSGETITVSPNSTTTYFVRGEGGCAATSDCSAAFTININPNPSNVITQNGTILTATEENGIYQWVDCNNGNQFINGATNRNFAPAVAGNYAALVSNAFDCQVLTNCINYSCIAATAPTISGDVYVCNGLVSSIPLNVTGNLNNNTSWAWYSGSCNGTLLGYGPTRNVGVGTYYVKGIAGCAGDGDCSQPFTVSLYNPTITITPVGNTLVTQDIPGATYAWTACNDNSVILGNQYIFTPPGTGSYKVYVNWSQSGNCASGAGCFQYNGPLSIPEDTKFDYKLFPNPVENVFEIQSEELIKEVTIYNVLGQKIAQFKNQKHYNIEHLSSGTYIIDIKSEEGIITDKIIKR
ncbi:T9SS type A sorting domain-containing protein [Flavobacterium sp. AS60]|uniref:T9SS type A sorting domain-containing protein n=1 Tax=Flavobacterium anseongense TaxID=2910677 RepID=UPI001F239302|nr:T9SS type A sorting domain-containing protein [Flavobacterium sp. AS60]MCF6130115.1 T9SS type A sorting domain-containing protein [Flavobacterium sp. AS60]